MRSKPSSDAESPKAAPRSRRKRSTSPSDADAYESNDSEDEPKPVPKKRKTVRAPAKRANGIVQISSRLFGTERPKIILPPCALPSRHHPLSYHRPLLLDRSEGRASLLNWFDGVTTVRGMPWRKPWVDPSTIADPTELRARLERRAYEVWISEIMLQQTRVAAVIEYWNRWMARWPTIRDLAAADPDDVLAMWRGLGYYSRATRIHEAARLVCADAAMDGLLPREVSELMARVPGVGRYTAGAITAIVFGKAEPMVDGNVLRVLSRQMGVFGDVKADKTVIETLWAAADALVKAFAADSVESKKQSPEAEGWGDNSKVSDRPGRWGQALMELGSTVCTPKPNCSACPISSSCRAYQEGLQYALKKPSNDDVKSTVPDIEDACTLCKPFEQYAEQDDDRDRVVKAQVSAKSMTVTTGRTSRLSSKKQMSLHSFLFSEKSSSGGKPAKERQPLPAPAKLDDMALEILINHARKFPVKVVKKAVREEETLVCAIRRRSDGSFLIHRRPEKGLLAGLWEFPSHTLPDTNDSTAKLRKAEAKQFVERVVGQERPLKYVGDLGSVPWLFSHLKLTMHVHLFELANGEGDGGSDEKPNDKAAQKSRWSADVEAESMGTGMRKCWTLVKETTHVGTVVD
jgi:A/G-specific adenine glycosylase